MFTPSSGLFSLVVLSSLSLSQAATSSTSPNAPPSAVPQCAANCMSIKITEAANWFGASDVQTYCQHPEFLEAYNICLRDHCQGDDLIAGKQAGEKTCAGVTSTAPGAPVNPNDPKNPTAHPPLSGPAGTPENSTLTAPKNGTNPGNSTPNGGLNNGTTGLNGALPTTTTSPNSPGSNASNATNRFSGAVGSAATNASSQAGAATEISSSSAIMLTAFSSCLLSLFI